MQHSTKALFSLWEFSCFTFNCKLFWKVVCMEISHLQYWNGLSLQMIFKWTLCCYSCIIRFYCWYSIQIFIFGCFMVSISYHENMSYFHSLDTLRIGCNYWISTGSWSCGRTNVFWQFISASTAISYLILTTTTPDKWSNSCKKLW